jgi:hypothetical protein
MENKTTDELFGNNGEPLFVVLVGKSMKGKSYMMRYLIQYKFRKGDYKFGLVFTKTNFNGDWNFIPQKAIKEGYNEEILMKYIDNLKAIKEKEGSIEPNFIIFDDLIGVLNNQTEWFVNFCGTVRHFNTSVFIAVQYLTGRNAISPIMREQTTHAILFNSRTRNTLDNLYQSYGGLFPSFNEFKDYFLKTTDEKYTAMLYKEDIDELENNYIPIKSPEFKVIPLDF